MAARAPYNFIPLNNKVVESEYDSWEKVPGFDKYEKNTGFIEVEIETKTPIYIRNMKDLEEFKKDSENYQPSEFFQVDKQYRIPGSSLKGLIRNLVEITSYGKFSYTDYERKLYFRAVADSSSRGTYYKEIMIDENDNYFPKIKAGVLKKEGKDYVIYKSMKRCGTSFYRVNYDKQSRQLICNSKIEINRFETKVVYFEPVEATMHLHHHGHFTLKYPLVKKVSLTPDNNLQKGYLISSGDFGKKKHMHWIINEESQENEDKIVLSEEIVNDYINDESRSEKVGLVRPLKDKKVEKLPCFYIEKDGKIISFGHTGMFRLPYSKTIGNMIPENLKDEETIDIPIAIFGDENKHAGRVFFEDSFVQTEGVKENEEKHPKILNSPKPTTFQHYLKQPQGSHTNKHNLKHWNSNTEIRGYKLYWHRKNENWYKNDNEIENKNVYTTIRTLGENVVFKGRIRFENLSNIELGALLFSLDLPENCYHKIGMGKPHGLGSIRITPKLILSNRDKSNENRYTKLFDNQNWFLAEEEVNIEEFKRNFEKYVLKRINENQNSLWDTNRLKELKTMLNWDNTSINNWIDKTRYMEIVHPKYKNEFKDREVLPKPTEVVE